MKSKIILILFLLLTFFGFGCNEEALKMYIESEDQVIIGNSINLKVFYENEEIPLENIGWSLSDYSIASIENGVLFGKDYGKVVVTVIDTTNTTHYCAKEIEVIAPVVTDIIITGDNELMINKFTQLQAIVVPEIIESPITWESSNEEIILVENGKVYAVNVGIADVIAKCDDFEKRFTIKVIPEPTEIIITGNSEVNIDGLTSFTYNIEEEVYLESSDSNIVEVIDNVIIGKQEGTATITAYKTSNPEVKGTIEITVIKGENYIEMTEEEKTKINTLIDAMSLEQLVGQMFNVGITATSTYGSRIDYTTGLPYFQDSYNSQRISITEYLQDYKFGNFTIKSVSGSTRANLQLAIKTLNSMGKTNTGVNPFISYEYSGGRGMDAISAIPKNEALANVNLSLTSEVVNIFASELQALGINLINNMYGGPYNMYSGDNLLFSYGDDVTKAKVIAEVVNNAYRNYNIIMMPNFNEIIWSADMRSLEEIKAYDYELMKSAINNGCEMLSIPAKRQYNNNDYIPYLDSEFMETYLRKELNYNGVVVLDHIATSYDLQNDFENFNERIIQGINLGLDMINFDLDFGYDYLRRYNQYYLGLYNSIIAAVQNDEIKLSRIKEAVTRILLVKLRNGVLDNKEASEFDYENVNAQLLSYMPKFISAEGELYKLLPEDNILLISISYEYTGTPNSVGDTLYKYLSLRGYKNITVQHFDTLSPSTVLNSVQNYSKIVIVPYEYIDENTKIGYASSAVNFINYVNDIKAKNPNICMIYMGEPDMKKYFENINNSVYLYYYYEEDFSSLCQVMAQDAIPNIIK